MAETHTNIVRHNRTDVTRSRKREMLSEHKLAMARSALLAFVLYRDAPALVEQAKEYDRLRVALHEAQDERTNALAGLRRAYAAEMREMAGTV